MYVVIPVIQQAQDLDSCYFQQRKSWDGACPAYNVCILQILDVQALQENLSSWWYTCIKNKLIISYCMHFLKTLFVYACHFLMEGFHLALDTGRS